MAGAVAWACTRAQHERLGCGWLTGQLAQVWYVAQAWCGVNVRVCVDAKIVILGGGGVGKTSMIHRYVYDEFANTLSVSTRRCCFLGWTFRRWARRWCTRSGRAEFWEFLYVRCRAESCELCVCVCVCRTLPARTSSRRFRRFIAKARMQPSLPTTLQITTPFPFFASM